jgi:hypothetical protein
MTDKSNPSATPLVIARGLVLPPDWRETTAEHIGTVIAIVGAPRPPVKPHLAMILGQGCCQYPESR